jgi:hypothetical protein
MHFHFLENVETNSGVHQTFYLVDTVGAFSGAAFNAAAA